MALWRLYYYVVWATKERRPFINSDVEAMLYSYLKGKADALGCIVHACGGIEDHIHLIISIPPKLSVADFVKTMKGSSTYHLNRIIFTNNKFSWQEGYGVFSLGSKQLDQAVSYVRNQKEHHSQKTAIASLEYVTDTDDPPSHS